MLWTYIWIQEATLGFLEVIFNYLKGVCDFYEFYLHIIYLLKIYKFIWRGVRRGLDQVGSSRCNFIYKLEPRYNLICTELPLFKSTMRIDFTNLVGQTVKASP